MCRTFGALSFPLAHPDLTVGPIYCRPFGPHLCKKVALILSLESGLFHCPPFGPHLCQKVALTLSLESGLLHCPPFGAHLCQKVALIWSLESGLFHCPPFGAHLCQKVALILSLEEATINSPDRQVGVERNLNWSAEGAALLKNNDNNSSSQLSLAAKKVSMNWDPVISPRLPFFTLSSSKRDTASEGRCGERMATGTGSRL